MNPEVTQQPRTPTERIDALRIAIDEAVESLNLVWGETKDGWGGENDRLVAAISALQRARTADDIANGRDWHRSR